MLTTLLLAALTAAPEQARTVRHALGETVVAGRFEDFPRERLGELQADVLFYFTYEEGDGRATDRRRAWTSDQAWLAMGAVRNGHAFHVDDGIWNTSGALLAARLLLDEVVRLLAGPRRPAHRR